MQWAECRCNSICQVSCLPTLNEFGASKSHQKCFNIKKISPIFGKQILIIVILYSNIDYSFYTKLCSKYMALERLQNVNYNFFTDVFSHMLRYSRYSLCIRFADDMVTFGEILEKKPISYLEIRQRLATSHMIDISTRNLRCSVNQVLSPAWNCVP